MIQDKIDIVRALCICPEFSDISGGWRITTIFQVSIEEECTKRAQFPTVHCPEHVSEKLAPLSADPQYENVLEQ